MSLVSFLGSLDLRLPRERPKSVNSMDGNRLPKLQARPHYL